MLTKRSVKLTDNMRRSTKVSLHCIRTTTAAASPEFTQQT